MLRKLLLFFSLIVATTAFFGFSKIYAPQQIIVTDIETKTAVNNIIKMVNENNFEQAMEQFEKIAVKDSVLIKQNAEIFNKLLTNYKKILIKKATKLIDNNEFAKASVLLNSKFRFYENDENILNILNTTENNLNKNITGPFNGVVEILHFKNILAYPDVALDSNNINFNEFDQMHLTANEFKKILHYLYVENYVLINPSMLYTVNKDEIILNELILPKNKKPVILILDHVAYPENPGSLADKTIIDRNRKIATYTSKKSIHDRVSYSREFTTILENFIAQNPSFSYNKSRAVICFNGVDGVLGYKTFRNNVAFKSEVKKVRKVAHKLKSLGYEFASSGYNKQLVNQKNNLELLEDVEKWKKEVETITQKTNLYNIYSNSINSLRTLSEHTNILAENEFYVLLTESNENNLNPEVVNILNHKFLVLPYKKVDGQTLRQKNSFLYKMLKSNDIYDNEFRTKPLIFS